MSSQISAVTRREKQLQELLEGNYFKQALDLCDKSLRKGDKSEELLVRECFSFCFCFEASAAASLIFNAYEYFYRS